MPVIRSKFKNIYLTNLEKSLNNIDFGPQNTPFSPFWVYKKFPELHRIRNLKNEEIYNKYKKKQPCKRNIHRLTFNCDVCFRDDCLIPVRNNTSIKTLITFTSTKYLN